MAKNVCGAGEKTLRVVIGIIFLAAGWFYSSYWGLIGIIPILTVLVGWCPISAILGVKTCELRGHTH